MHSGDGPADDRHDFDISVAHSARVHNYWLGGKDNYAADRAAGDAVIAAYPGIVRSVRANRAFLARVVRFLAAEAGIVQFLRTRYVTRVLRSALYCAHSVPDRDELAWPGTAKSRDPAFQPLGRTAYPHIITGSTE